MKLKGKRNITCIISFLIVFLLSSTPTQCQYRKVKMAERKKERQEEAEKKRYARARKAFNERHLDLQSKEVRKRLKKNMRESEKSMNKKARSEGPLKHIIFRRKNKKYKTDPNNFYLY